MKALKVTLLTAILTMVFCLPVMAQEITDPEKVIKEETFVTGEDALANEFHNSEVWRSENYVKYLDGVIYNLNGQKMSGKPAKGGLYIMNGKKILVK